MFKLLILCGWVDNHLESSVVTRLLRRTRKSRLSKSVSRPLSKSTEAKVGQTMTRKIVQILILTLCAVTFSYAAKIKTVETVIGKDFVQQFIKDNDPVMLKKIDKKTQEMETLKDKVDKGAKGLPPKNSPFYESNVKQLRQWKQEYEAKKRARNKEAERYVGIARQKIRLHGDEALGRQKEARYNSIGVIVANRKSLFSWLTGGRDIPILHVWSNRSGKLQYTFKPPDPSKVGPAADIVIMPGSSKGKGGTGVLGGCCSNGLNPLSGWCPDGKEPIYACK